MMPSQGAKQAMTGFGQFVIDAIKEWNVPGLALAIVSDGEVIKAQGFGLRDVDQGLPVTIKTLFAIGSCTKAFTAFVLGTLVDQGRLDWDTPVRTYVPVFRLYDPIASELLTPRDMLTHRSGLPRHDLLWYNNNELSREEMVRRLAFLEPSETFRGKFQYNNLMYLTAGYLIGRLTGRTWEEAVHERIFEPLNMKRSNFSVRDSQKDVDFALPYREKSNKIEPVPFRNIDIEGPAGSINSSVEDMSQWLLVNLNHGKVVGRQLLASTTLADIHSPHMTTGASVERPEISQPTYGLGWLVDIYRGHLRVHHGGGIDGFTANVALFPNDGIGLVVLANKSATGLPEVLTRHAADRLLGLDPIDWNREGLERRAKGKEAEEEGKAKKEMARKPGTQPAHDLAAYAGEYEHPGYGSLSVQLSGDRLELSYNNITTPLEHWHYDVFSAAEGAADDALENTKFLFRTDMKGNVAAVEAALEPQVKNVVFPKKPDARMFDPNHLRQFAGEYDLAGQVVTIALSGNVLTASIPGQPQFTLAPDVGSEFVVREFSVISLRFTQDEGGKVVGFISYQPEGVFTATRRE